MAQRSGATISRRTGDEILRQLARTGPLSRSELAAHVGISRTTLSELTASLLAEGAIVVLGTDAASRDGRGRPAERLALDPGAAQFVGVDFARDRVLVAVANASHEIIAEGRASYGASSTWEDRVAVAFELVESLGQESEVRFGAVRAIAIGFPGPLSPHAHHQADVRGAKASDFVTNRFAETFGVPVVVDNNARFSALAEASWERDIEAVDLLYIRVSRGIGGGLVIGGRLTSGAFGYAAELGHVTVDRTGLDCHCGKRGCLETIASLTAIISDCQAAGAAVDTVEELHSAAMIGDPIVTEVLRDAADAIGRVLGAAAVVINPSEIVLGGELVGVWPLVVDEVRRIVSYELIPMSGKALSIRESRLGDHAGAYGALAALFHRSSLLSEYPRPRAHSK